MTSKERYCNILSLLKNSFIFVHFVTFEFISSAKQRFTVEGKLFGNTRMFGSTWSSQEYDMQQFPLNRRNLSLICLSLSIMTSSHSGEVEYFIVNYFIPLIFEFIKKSIVMNWHINCLLCRKRCRLSCLKALLRLVGIRLFHVLININIHLSSKIAFQSLS